ncbi:ABC transporter permease subunit [Methylobacterium sp. NEAU 140]|uniref:ABC transporter permease n=1 Tax=Methylobacterium sp. NEAU 140 TaxID=3064945 RepID=UPI002733EB12|nr:ABC transporter permease subunit [Methylobacterium sp. NEAU 140]MDP4026583.1 ABC transporter permease subunit [Methylobacterium sp. NEAU 140]
MRTDIIRRRIAYSILLAAYAFLISPLIVVAAASLDTGSTFAARFPPLTVGLRWYLEIPGKYWQALSVSLTAAAIASVISGALGVMAALGIVRGKVPGTELLRAFFRIPLQIPLVVTGVVFLQFYYGFQTLVGLELAATLPGLIIAYVFVGTPYTVGTVAALLERLSPRLDEAAAILGCSRWQTFWLVTFPIIRPSLIAGMLYAFVVAFGDVPLSIFLSSPSYTTLPVEIFQTLQFDFNPTVLAVSTLVAVMSVISLWMIQRLVGLDMVPR